MSYSCLELYFC